MVSDLRFIVAIIVMLQLGAAGVFAQQLPLRVFSEDQGLNSLSVMDIKQASSGYVWVASMSGVYRFDGQSFKEYRYDGGSIWYVMEIMEDRDGTIWLASGLGLYRIKNNSVERVSDTGFSSNGGFISLFQHDDGRTWFGSSDGGAGYLDGYQPVYPPELSRVRAYRMFQVQDDCLLIASHRGLKMYEPVNGRLSTLLDGYQVRDVAVDEKGRRWLATFSGVLVLDGWNVEAHYHTGNGMPSDEVWRVKYTDGRIHAATTAGLVVFDDEGITEIIGEEHGLTNSQIQAVETDREGNLLLGSSYSGIFQMYSRLFSHYPLMGPERQVRVTHITSDQDNRLLVSTWNDGVFILDPENRQRLMQINREHGLPEDRITTTAALDDGQVLIGTRHHGLFIYRDGLASRPEIPGAPNGDYILYAMQHPDGSVWMSIHGEGIFRYAEGGFSRPLEGLGFDDYIVTTIRYSPDNSISMALRNGGVALYDGEAIRILDTDAGLPDPLVFTLETDTQNRLWVGHHSGLSLFNGDAFHNFTEDNPLGGEFVLSIVSCDTGRVLFGLTRGLMVYEDGTFRTYNRADGLASDRFEDGAAYRDGKGYLWLGTYDGLIRVDPAVQAPESVVPPVYIEQLQHMNRAVAISSSLSIP